MQHTLPSLKFTDRMTTRTTAKAWLTPENVLVPLKHFHYEYFADPTISKKYGVAFGEEVPTRLAALRAGFVRLNYEVNGGLLTIETMRWNEALRRFTDRLIVDNADALDFARLHMLDNTGQMTRLGCARLMHLRMVGRAITRTNLGPWNNAPVMNP